MSSDKAARHGLRVLAARLSVCRAGVDARATGTASNSGTALEFAARLLSAASAATSGPSASTDEFLSISVIQGELSVVTSAQADELAAVFGEGLVEAGWRAVGVEGPLAFELVGILAGLVEPLRAAGISVFAISTYDTDYILVKAAQLEAALATWEAQGHPISRDQQEAPPSDRVPARTS